jgi:hypothetical protein
LNARPPPRRFIRCHLRSGSQARLGHVILPASSPRSASAARSSQTPVRVRTTSRRWQSHGRRSSSLRAAAASPDHAASVPHGMQRSYPVCSAVASPAGFEPTAPGLGILCSIRLSYGDLLLYISCLRAWWGSALHNPPHSLGASLVITTCEIPVATSDAPYSITAPRLGVVGYPADTLCGRLQSWTGR